LIRYWIVRLSGFTPIQIVAGNWRVCARSGISAGIRGQISVLIHTTTLASILVNKWWHRAISDNEVRNKALAALDALPQKELFDAVLWHQGETDWSADGSLDPDLAGAGVENDYYSIKLWQLIDNFRKDSWFGQNRPFICGETVRSPVNSRLNALNYDTDRWTACVSSDNLPTYDAAQVHFSAVGLRQLGAKYADQYLNMTGG